MPTETDLRRQKKNRRRGHVAQPEIRLGRELIPGVPGFQGGGSVGTNPSWPSLPMWGFNPTLPADRPEPPFENYEYYVTMGRMLGVSPEQARVLDGVSPGMLQQLLGTGGTGGPSAPQWRPGELQLQQDAQRLQEIRDELQRLSTMATIENQQGQLEVSRRRNELLAEQNQIQERLGLGGLDVEQRGQDMTYAVSMLNAYLADLNSQRDDAIARGDLALRTVTEQRIARTEQLTLELTQRQQDIETRGQDMNWAAETNRLLADVWQVGLEGAIARGDLQLQREIEQRQRATQRQDVIFQQHEAALASAGLGVQAQTSAAGQMGQLAQSLGDITARRGEFLSETAANPRDFMQLQFALGGGESFLNQLRQGKPFEGQGVNRIGGTPTLGAGFNRLTEAITARPDMAYFEEAREMMRRLGNTRAPAAPNLLALQRAGQMPGMTPMPQAPQMPEFNFPQFGPPTPVNTNQPPQGAFDMIDQLYGNLPPALQSPDFDWNAPPPAQYAEGGQLVTNEPIVGMGLWSRKPRFTAGEEAPELIDIKPMAAGGQVNTGQSLMPKAPKPAAKPLALPAPSAPGQAQAAPRAPAAPRSNQMPTININFGGQPAASGYSPQPAPTFGGQPVANNSQPRIPPGYDPWGGLTPPRIPPGYDPWGGLTPPRIPPDYDPWGHLGTPENPPPGTWIPPPGMLPPGTEGDPISRTPRPVPQDPNAPEGYEWGPGPPWDPNFPGGGWGYWKEDPDRPGRWSRWAGGPTRERRDRNVYRPGGQVFRRLQAGWQERMAAKAEKERVNAPGYLTDEEQVVQYLRNMRAGAGPQGSALLGYQEEGFGSILSALGVPPSTFWETFRRQLPTAPNPAMGSMGSFAKGGTVLTAPCLSPSSAA